MQYELDRYEKIFTKYKDKYKFDIYLEDIFDRAGYNLYVKNDRYIEHTQISYSLYYSMAYEEFDKLLDKIVTYSYQDEGMKDKPRFPSFKGFRSKLDF